MAQKIKVTMRRHYRKNNDSNDTNDVKLLCEQLSPIN